MVKTSVIIAVCVTLFISLILPVLGCIVYGLKNKRKGIWTAWLLGAAGFVVFQLIIRIPVLNVLSLNQGFLLLAQNHYILYSFILAFSAALFEVAGRFLAARIMNKKLTFEKGVAAGLGHGGIEAMAIIGIMYVNNLIYIIMINSGSFDTVVAQTAALGADTSALLSVKDALVNSNALMFYMAGYERIVTMIAHTALSLLVCYFVSRKKDLRGIVICLGCHCLMDFVSPIVNGMATGYLGNRISQTTASIIVYLWLTIVAAVAIVAIFKIKKCWKESIEQ